MFRGLRRLVMQFGRRAFIEFALSVHDIEVDCGIGQLSECTIDDLALIVAQRASVFGGAWHTHTRTRTARTLQPVRRLAVPVGEASVLHPLRGCQEDPV